MYKIITIFSFLISITLCSQVGINIETPDNSALLDIHPSPSGKGVLLPRINLQSTTDAVTISNPAKGLTVYNTNGFIGEGMYVNEGTSTTPLWVKLKLSSDSDTRTVSVLAYPGNTTNTGQVLQTDTFEWRLVSNGANTGYSLQMRLKAAPSANVVTTNSAIMNWRYNALTPLPFGPFTWTPGNWSTWQTIYTYQSDYQTFFYFGIVGTQKLFRVNAFVSLNAYNSLMVEQF